MLASIVIIALFAPNRSDVVSTLSDCSNDSR